MSTNGSGRVGTTGVAVATVFSVALMLAVSKGFALTIGLNFKPCLGGDALNGGTIGTATGIGMGVPPGVVWGVMDRSTSTMSSSSGGANSGSGMLSNLLGDGGNSSEVEEVKGVDIHVTYFGVDGSEISFPTTDWMVRINPS